ncbi:relaxase/mobilization nuclease domain-containing protein [Kineococcus indalonis]|uniref:relaxase/mobilization nuclease domain-containing protein n=1 Tax=Kineococcus indalonis TaxID=2696566 RepID=UPI001412A0F7|nr:relaxase [Kineococcus indalonis]NAZ85231.1 relaxase [Kineococcus indalonis]
MIGKVSRGSDTAGLLRYLFGPGRANEHTNPHLVAAWDADDPQALAALAPVYDGRRHDVRALAGLLDQPLAALPRRPSSTVWHCSLRTAPGDVRLSDGQWAEAARTVLDRVGLVPAGDVDACRWVAVRHAEDHVHLLLTLARQDGASARTSHDYRRVGEACRDLEVRHDLRRTPPREGTATRRPTRAESEKAAHHGRREASRDTLRREVRLAAAATSSPESFLADLRARGLLVKVRHSTRDAGEVTGYAVAWPGDRNREGQPVWFSGSRLSDELSLPRLQALWRCIGEDADASERRVQLRSGSTSSPALTSAPWQGAVRAARRAARLVETGRLPAGELDALAWAAGQLLLTVARTVEGSRGGALTAAADAHGLVLGRGRHRPAAAAEVAVPLLCAARALARQNSSPPVAATGLTALVHEVLVVLDAAHRALGRGNAHLPRVTTGHPLSAAQRNESALLHRAMDRNVQGETRAPRR